MKPFTTYGLKCLKRDERTLVMRVNGYLETLSRAMSKAKNQAMLDGHLPFVLKHFYWNLNKGVGTWFELFPNEDEEGKFFDESHQECGWLLKTRINLTHPNYDKIKTERFLTEVLQASKCDYVILMESDTDDVSG